MKNINILLVLLFVGVLISCENEKSLQKFYVENQEDSDFLALDIPTSMFANMDSLDEEQKSTLNSVKKINLLALKANTDHEKFEEEKAQLNDIFKDEKYQLLMKYGGGNKKAALYFTGEEDAIDELIVYGYDDEKGLGVARVLGENMDPEKIMKFMKSLDGNDINIEGIKNIGEIINSAKKSDDSLQGDHETSQTLSDSI
ncbi:DUF4252 domain-containing protein [Christiangramia fulva]|uniref:DUF4252 domain-containing protein n=1 Tax=Christiangramia fulva TaxID=2126553 RepID=A0A2R3Z8S3_9FLAO|nr:DUF4252 domain-containing protein [Christiangramia fulva]AVR46653.1 DUF4252 domain-containing protein [Christiangramia fulva]